MRDAPLPLTRDLVLIGGGHAHALVLRAWGMDPLPGARLTLVDPGPTAPYTGMLPGFVAGHYDRDALEIDLVRLARFAGARLIFGRATAIDREAGEIAIEDAILGSRRIGYDVVSLDIGIHSDMPDIPGFADHAVAAKPLGRLASAWTRHLDTARAAPKAVIGGGVGGVELAMAMAHGSGGAPVAVIERGPALSGFGARARRLLLAELERTGVTLIEHADVAGISADAVALVDGRTIPACFVTGAAGARPYDWVGATGLALTDGFVRVDATLRSVTDPRVFAAGDCAHMGFAPRPKAGVFAVRQAPILAANFRAALGAGGMRRYRPQRSYLKLVSLGDKAALAEKAGWAVKGRWLWRWKDRIDARFMARLAELPAMAPPALPRHRAAGMEALTRQAPCGGCAAKVGQAALARALAGLGPPHRADVEAGPGDDAAILRMGAARQVLTIDQLSAVTEDPGLMAHIAAHHALGDCLAMGAAPQAMLSVLTLPRATRAIEARLLAEITAAAARVAAEAGADIVGGHSATGAALGLGFAVTGTLGGAAITLAGGREGDALILTKPLGSGVIMAAEMALEARGAWVRAALEQMARPQFTAARALSGAHAMTDVTGFGLAGHLLGLCDASRLGAEIDLAALPLMDGAAELLARGTRSTLHETNRAAADRITLPDDPRAEILFDPQTAGGLLAAVAPADAENLLIRLSHAGHAAARIGTLVAGPPAIRAR